MTPHTGADCAGDPALPALLEEWHEELRDDPERVHGLLDLFGSPVHLHRPGPFLRNAEILQNAARSLDVDLQLFFARKANRAMIHVESAIRAGVGVDVASEAELTQSLEAGVEPELVVLTAAVKPESLLRLAAATGVTVVVDNHDELDRLTALARQLERRVPIAVRLKGFPTPRGRMESRFGFHESEVDGGVDSLLMPESSSSLNLVGLHFHLDGYDADERVIALDRCLRIADRLAAKGKRLRFIDMGGGFPVSYVQDASAWQSFLTELDRALRGERPRITWQNHGFGRFLHEGELVGKPAVYPHHQSPVGAEWLTGILASRRRGPVTETIADGLRTRRLQLRAEPGRALVHGCGATLARVEHRKRMQCGTILIGLSMNGSNCRTMKSELLVDPILVPRPGRSSPDPAGPPSADRMSGLPMEAVLTGMYCTESDVIMSRVLRFRSGVQVGDAVMFPNTAGYYMHFIESRSHQIPIPENIVLGPG